MKSSPSPGRCCSGTGKHSTTGDQEKFTRRFVEALFVATGLHARRPSATKKLQNATDCDSLVGVKGFDPSSNGLGLNNILYVSILIEYFHRRLARQKSAGQIILLEEPEAHLHPQLQLSLFSALNALPFQSILTTHSTHITANAGLRSYVVLTQTGVPAISSAVPAAEDALEPSEVLDLERYLDATKGMTLAAG